MCQPRHLRMVAQALLAGVVVLLAAAVPAAKAQTNYSYQIGAPNGPNNWGGTCNTGMMQSPIALNDLSATLMISQGLDYNYLPVQASVVNRGHDISLNFTGNAGSLVINGTTYNLKMLHWHTPSEHTVDGRRYAMEMHMVHKSADNKIAVIAIFYYLGSTDPFLLRLEPFIVQVRNVEGKAARVGVVNPPDIPRISLYFRYTGSLTTPPCDEGVTWTVVKLERPVALYQVQILQDAVVDGYEYNARPIQPTNNRSVSLNLPIL